MEAIQTEPSGVPSLGNKVISGVVRAEKGPVPGAIVRVQTTEITAIAGSGGRFALLAPATAAGGPLALTAWAPGYFNGGPVEASPGDGDIEIQLHAHPDEDDPDYTWLPARSLPGQESVPGCAECHSAGDADLPFTLPVEEWLEDAHSQTTRNLRFLTMYTGRDVHGNQSPSTRYGVSRDYGRFPLQPDSNQPYYGPGYKLDFPETAGNCAACHAPAAAVDAPYSTDPTELIGVLADGVLCDFCHKVWDVRLNPSTGLPDVNMPGVLSFEFRRPPEGHQFFAGPFDDVAPGEDTYSPLQIQGQFCAPCHFGVFWNTQVYNSFGEWLASPYSDPESGKTCQDCHMPPLGADRFVQPEKGGLKRDPQQIFSHRMPGAASEALLQNAVTMTAAAQLLDQRVVVDVRITNDMTGHHVPTDSPLRHLILLVEARDRSGQPLTLLDGPRLPDWVGVGERSQGYFGGQPGKAYAKLLEELWTEIFPSGAYWNPTRLVSDNRLAAFQTDVSSYSFEAPPDSVTVIEIRLFFRRAFIGLRDQKGWDLPDILMESVILRLP